MKNPTLISPARKIWIVLAHRSKARILSQAAQSKSGFVSVKELAHPDGRRQTHDMVTDDHGSRNGSGMGAARHGLDPHQEAAEHVADLFAHSLAKIIRTGRTQASFDDLILVAEPAFLGRMKLCLDGETAKRVLMTVNCNWTDLPDEDLNLRINKLVADHRGVA